MFLKTKTAGITLLETLISIAMLSMVMGALSIAIFQASTFQNKSDALLEAKQKSRIVLNVIRTDFRSAVYLPNHAKRPNNDGETGILGLNKKEQDIPINQVYMHVHAKSKLINDFDKITDPEVHEIAYFLIKNEEDDFYSLYRSEKFYIHLRFEKLTSQNQESILGDNLNRKNILLSSNVISFEIEYIQGYKSDNTPNSSKTWNSRKLRSNHLPESISVKLAVQNKEGEILEERMNINVRPKLGKGVEWAI